MNNSIILIAGGIIIGLLIGFIVAKVLEKSNASKLVKEAKKSAALILKVANSDGESIKKDKDITKETEELLKKAGQEFLSTFK